jgi:hypothetical protein
VVMKHRGIDFGVEEDQPGLWRWIIYPKIEAGPEVVGEPSFLSHEAAVSSAIDEVNNGLDRLKLRRGGHD